MLKHLKVAFFILCLTLPLLLWGGYQNIHHILSMSRGNYFFEQTKNSPIINAFHIKFADGATITLEKKENFWRIKEADDYFADFVKINSFMKLILLTTVYRADYVDQKVFSSLTKNAFSITSFDKHGKIIDEATIIPKEERNKFHYAFLNKKNILYQLNGSFNLSSVVTDWIQLPLLAVPYEEIKFIRTDNFSVYRRFAADIFKSADGDKELPNLKNLTDALWYLSATDVKHAVHFNRADYKMKKTYEITTFTGLIYELNLFYNRDEYWISIMPRAANIISNQAKRFLEENRILYDGWFFRLAPNIGAALVGFAL